MYSEMVVEDNWEPTPWPPEVALGTAACAMTDLQYVFYLALGGVVVCAALGVWVARKWILRCARNGTELRCA